MLRHLRPRYNSCLKAREFTVLTLGGAQGFKTIDGEFDLAAFGFSQYAGLQKHMDIKRLPDFSREESPDVTVRMSRPPIVDIDPEIIEQCLR